MSDNAPSPEFISEFRYRNTSVELLRASPDAFQSELVHVLLTKEKNPANRKDVEKYFGPSSLPGTSSIGLRKEKPEIFQDTINVRMECYEHWLQRIVENMLVRLLKNPAFSSLPDGQTPSDIIQKMLSMLDFKSVQGTAFRDLIPQQTYEDSLMHILLSMLNNTFEYNQPDNYKEFNAICHKIGLDVLAILEDRNLLSTEDIHIQSLLHMAVLSGYVGVNLKTTASAASTLLNRDLIPIDSKWIEDPAAVAAVSRKDIRHISELLINTSTGYQLNYGIDCTSDYNQEVVRTRIPTLIIFFTDDYLETILDLKRFELLMSRNSNITVLVIPRNGRYGNDFAYEDIDGITEETIFQGIKKLHAQNRFVFSPHGPRGGCIDPRFFSTGLIAEIQTLTKGKKIILETKGCRNFEMLKGQIPMPWYASFNCNRALSIRTVGIDIDPVFLRIPPGLNAYDGFERPVIGETPSKLTKGVKFAGMTTNNLVAALHKGVYKKLLASFRQESRLNAWLMKLCTENDLTLPGLLDSRQLNEAYKTP